MLFAHGSFRWLAADAVNTTYSQTCTDVGTGATFQPKAIRFYWMGLGSASDQASEAIHSRRGGGFATGTADRRCVATQDQDATGSMTCTTGYRTDCCVMTLTSTPAADGRLDLDALLSTGFRMIVDDQGVVDLVVCWEAWGGPDLAVATTLEIAEPAGTGNQDYTVTGFTATGVDQVVMVFGVQETGSAQVASRNDSGFMAGFASGPSAEQCVVLGNNDDGSANADTDGYGLDGECLAMITVAGGNPSARASLTQWNSNGFRLNWAARATTGRKYIALAIKGGRWKAGGFTIAGNSGGATASVTGLGWTPLGVSLLGRMTTESTAGTATAQDRMSLGSGSAPSSRRAMGHLSEDGTGSAEIDLVLEYDQILAYPSTAGALLTAYDLDAMLDDGFRLIVDTAGGVASEWIGYLTFGNETEFPVDTAGLSEVLARQLGRVLSEASGFTEQLAVVRARLLGETVGLGEGLGQARQLGLSDTVGLGEAVARTIPQPLGELLRTLEAHVHQGPEPPGIRTGQFEWLFA
jgi:hypothetical protein